MRAEAEVGIRRASGLERLYADNIEAAVRLAYLMTGDQEQARDIAQDAFVKVAGRFHGLRDPEAFPAYLRTTVINLSRGYFRKLKTQRDYIARQTPGEELSPGPDLGGRDEMWRALQTLPDRQRAALVLRYYEDLSEHQIADALGISKSAAKSLLSRGLQQLRTQMRGEA